MQSNLKWSCETLTLIDFEINSDQEAYQRSSFKNRCNESQRLLEHATSLNILHKSQIGLLPQNRTSDHLLTLRTLIDKYVHWHGEKVYACFVDFRKAFDSVWHDGLLYKLLQIGVRGCFYKLIKNQYSNCSFTLKIRTSQTRSFSYSRGVRQGCICAFQFIR